MFRLGLIINPIAGLGGPLGLKGSDQLSAVPAVSGRRSQQRARQALELLQDLSGTIEVFCYSGAMGEAAMADLGLPYEVVGSPDAEVTTAADTVAAAEKLSTLGVDLLVFTGGDGTARDIYNAVGDNTPALGIPAGVKMHSGVYAVSPAAAAEVIRSMAQGRLVDIGQAEVRDIDEQAFQQGTVRARYYGELLVPRAGQFVQQVKSGGREVEELVVADIAADIVENMQEGALYLIGPGSTTRGIMEELGLVNTLLGVDAVCDGELLGSDLNERQILELIEFHSGEVWIVVTAIGGQGHILGRGNQQISPAVIRKAGIDHLKVVATKTKITELNGRPLLVDSNDPELDRELEGYLQVITGYRDAIIYPVGWGAGSE